MTAHPIMQRTARCACGRVAFEASGAPILSVACYCDDCQAAARQIEALPNAPPVQDPDGGTALVLYRKDRVRCSEGAELLRDHKIKETSPTKRVVASCCNSAMLLNFEKGHWFSICRARLQGDAPPLQMRIQTKYAPDKNQIPDDVPTYPTWPFKFVTKLMAAWIPMLLRR